MSGSETGLIASREAYGVGIEKNPISSKPPMIQNMRLGFSADGTAVYQPISPSSPSFNRPVVATAAGEGSAGGTVQGAGVDMNMSGEPMKRKRERPRKYAPDGSNSLAFTHAVATQSVGPSSSSAVGGAASPTSYSVKKPRGRPPGSSSKKHQLEALGSAGLGFTPHVITVKAGEDVSAKIMSFSQQGPRAVCILSANGAISNVTLRQPATSGGTVTYEGRYEILSLSGSFMLLENGGQRSRTGGLSVSLAGPDGRVVGGCVAGLLTAAAPVQVVVGSFIANGQKGSKSTNQAEPSLVTPKLPPSTISAAEAGSPASHGTLSESSSDKGSPLNQSAGAYNNSDPKGMSAIPWK